MPAELAINASPRSRRARTRSLLALGMALAARGALAMISLGIAALTVLGASVAAFVMAGHSDTAPLEQLPSLTASALSWGAGVLIAFAAAAQSLRNDRTAGIVALLNTRGAMGRGYLWARVGGLALLLALVTCGGTLVAGLVATMLASRIGLAAQVLGGTLAAVAYALAFSATLAPVAMAALGARSRAGGYVSLLLVLVIPELLQSWTARMVPYEWRDLTSIPATLGAVRTSLMAPSIDVAHLVRSAVVLAVVVALSLLVVRRMAVRLENEGDVSP